MSDIFLSYAREDAGRIRPLVEGLESQGFSVFWDHEIAPGEAWSEALRREMDAAKAVVVIWSETSIKSKWVQAEASTADHKGKLVPVRIDDVTPPMPFGMLQMFDLSDPFTGPAPEQVAMFNEKLLTLTKPSAAGGAPLPNDAARTSAAGRLLGSMPGRTYLGVDGRPMFAGFWRRFGAAAVDYVVVGFATFLLAAALTALFPSAMPHTRLSLPFGLLTSDKTLESKTSHSVDRDGSNVTVTERIVERRVAGGWTYLLRIVETETEKKNEDGKTSSIKPPASSAVTRLDPVTRREIAGHDLFRVVIALLLFYSAAMEASGLQATIGKLLIGLRVTDERGKRCSFRAAFLRNILKLLSGLILLIGFAMAGWTRKKQGLHDIIAKCYVLQTRS